MYTIKTLALFDLARTLAEPLLAGCPFPWQALPELKAFIRALGPQLDRGEYEEVAENIWVARDAGRPQRLSGPLIIGHNGVSTAPSSGSGAWWAPRQWWATAPS